MNEEQITVPATCVKCGVSFDWIGDPNTIGSGFNPACQSCKQVVTHQHMWKIRGAEIMYCDECGKEDK